MNAPFLNAHGLWAIYRFEMARGLRTLWQSLVTPVLTTSLTFLGGAFYAIDMLPEPWRTVSLFNPVVYLISGFRWRFFGVGDVAVGVSLAVTGGFLILCLAIIAAIFRTGWRMKN